MIALKGRTEVFDPAAGIWPQALQWSNDPAALSVAPFGTCLVNSVPVPVTGGILIAQLTTITLAAHAFAWLSFPGKNLLFTFFLLQIRFPIYASQGVSHPGATTRLGSV